eukprot:673581-Rhodomonas_salina.2
MMRDWYWCYWTNGQQKGLTVLLRSGCRRRRTLECAHARRAFHMMCSGTPVWRGNTVWPLHLAL